MHACELKVAGEADERIFGVAAWRDAPWFTPAERAALELTEAITRIGDRPDPVPDAIWDEAARHYDEPALASLLLEIAQINVWNRLNAATRQVAGEWRPECRPVFPSSRCATKGGDRESRCRHGHPPRLRHSHRQGVLRDPPRRRIRTTSVSAPMGRMSASIPMASPKGCCACRPLARRRSATDTGRSAGYWRGMTLVAGSARRRRAMRMGRRHRADPGA